MIQIILTVLVIAMLKPLYNDFKHIINDKYTTK